MERRSDQQEESGSACAAAAAAAAVVGCLDAGLSDATECFLHLFRLLRLSRDSAAVAGESECEKGRLWAKACLRSQSRQICAESLEAAKESARGDRMLSYADTLARSLQTSLSLSRTHAHSLSLERSRHTDSHTHTRSFTVSHARRDASAGAVTHVRRLELPASPPSPPSPLACDCCTRL